MIKNTVPNLIFVEIGALRGNAPKGSRFCIVLVMEPSECFKNLICMFWVRFEINHNQNYALLNEKISRLFSHWFHSNFHSNFTVVFTVEFDISHYEKHCEIGGQRLGNGIITATLKDSLRIWPLSTAGLSANLSTPSIATYQLSGSSSICL